MADHLPLPERELIDRREAIRQVSALLGGVALVGGNALLKGRVDRTRASSLFTADDVALLDEIAETILPTTSTPGAKAAKVGAFMALMVEDSYDDEQQRIFRDGLGRIEQAARVAYGVGFMRATPGQRLAVLKAIDKEQKEYGHGSVRRSLMRATLGWLDRVGLFAGATGVTRLGESAASSEGPPHYFRLMKELALLGYFTSEVGCTQAQRYVETPGRFDPCVPCAPGERAWAPHA